MVLSQVISGCRPYAMAQAVVRPFTLQHALECPKGGLIKRRHKNIRDHDAKLADFAWGKIHC